MAATGFKGLDVRQTGSELVFRAFLQTAAGALLGTGTTTISIIEIESDGTIKSYDFNDNTFKTGTLTTPTLALTHRPSNNAATTTGYWTASLSTLTEFTVGAVYAVFANNTGASPTDQCREFQFGGAEGDLLTQVVSTGVADLVVNLDPATSVSTTPIAGTVGASLLRNAVTIGRIGTAQAGGASTITLDAGASSAAGAYVGDGIWLYGGTGGGAPGTGQFRTITAYNTSTKVATVNRAWGTNPDNTTGFMTVLNPKGDTFNWMSGAVPTPNQTGVPIIDVGYLLGTVWQTPTTPGIPDVGNVTGSVIGNILGALLGPVANDVWGSLLGKVIGGGPGVITGVGAQVDLQTIKGQQVVCDSGPVTFEAGIIATTTNGVSLTVLEYRNIADTVLRRHFQNVESSSVGDSLSQNSLYGMGQQLQNSTTTANPGKLTIFRTDGSTTLGTRTITDVASANPITGITN